MQDGESVKVKICGVTCSEDAQMCEDLGADAIGFVYFPGRPRSLPLSTIAETCSSLGVMTPKVLVCKPTNVDMAQEMFAHSGADILQLYSLQPNEVSKLRDCGIKVMRVVRSFGGEAERYASVSDALVFEDGVPGTGTVYDYSRIPVRLRSQSFIAGGLTPDNVHVAKALKPYGVDVSSGVETQPGRKDAAKVEDFIRRCRT